MDEVIEIQPTPTKLEFYPTNQQLPPKLEHPLHFATLFYDENSCKQAHDIFPTRKMSKLVLNRMLDS